MTMPDWLLQQIETRMGIAYAPGFKEQVQAGRCRSCGASVLRARDDEQRSATTDAYAVTRIGEGWAVMDGRATWRLVGIVVQHMWRRHEQNIGDWPIGGVDSSGAVRVVVEHRCRQPAPNAWRECQE